MTSTKIINMTPHVVNLISKDGKIIRKFESDGVIRLSQSTLGDNALGDIPLSKTTFGSVELPEKKEDTYYIVSSLVCQACPDRNDLLIVNETVRGEEGRIIGCKSFSINPFYTGDMK